VVFSVQLCGPRFSAKQATQERSKIMLQTPLHLAKALYKDLKSSGATKDEIDAAKKKYKILKRKEQVTKEAEVTAVTPLPITPSNSDSRPVCKQFLEGRCTRGKCKFRHPEGASGTVAKTSMSACRDFLKGKCKRGDLCKFTHDTKKKEAAIGTKKDVSNKVCYAWQNGKCLHGANCKFKHLEKEAQICREFRKGWCFRGELCLYLHDGQQGTQSGTSIASPTSSPLPSTHKTKGIKSDQICYQFKVGTCTRGADCKFSHISLENTQLKKELKSDGKQRFCFPFQKGECKRGDLCKFAHRSGGASNFSGVCFAFEKDGTCEKGDECKFQHIQKGEKDDGSINNAQAIYRICYAFKKDGQCKKGDDCPFNHIINIKKKRSSGNSVVGESNAKRQRKEDPKLSKKERNKKAAIIRSRGFKKG
jgi:hypothetical protein